MYKRVLLKLSGEALSSKEYNVDPAILNDLAQQIKEIKSLDIDLAIVVGGGNYIRGKSAQQIGIDRVQADYMGMLATMINALAIQSSLEKVGVVTRVMSAIEMQKVAEPFIIKRALRHLSKDRVVIFGAGTGSPFFSTDTTAALRASEIKADVILMAKNGVDGVYSDDPKNNKGAIKYTNLKYIDLIKDNLMVMDATATSMCMDNNIDLVIFNMNKPGNIKKAILRENIGTIVKK